MSDLRGRCAQMRGHLEERVDRDRALRRLLEPPPGPAPDVECDKPGCEGREDVVVDAVAYVRDLAGPRARKREEPLEKRGIGLADAEARRARHDVDEEPGGAHPLLHRGALVPGDAGEYTGRSHFCEGRPRVPVEIGLGVHDPSCGRGTLHAEMPPELPVLLAALDRLAEGRPDDVRLDARDARDLAPVVLLVDEVDDR